MARSWTALALLVALLALPGKSGAFRATRCSRALSTRGTVLSVAERWSDNLTVTHGAALGAGACAVWRVDSVGAGACSTAAPDGAILVEFWKVADNSSSAGSSSSSSTVSLVENDPALDLFLVAARGAPPVVETTDDGMTLFWPPLRSSNLEVPGTVLDEYGSLYLRPYQRMLLPLDAPAVAAGEMAQLDNGGSGPGDGKSWYIRVANLNEANIPLPGYLIRASCVPGVLSSLQQPDAPPLPPLPCPTPDPYGAQCLGRGVCRTDSRASPHTLASRYCECSTGYAGPGCQRALETLPLNATQHIQLPPGGWAYFAVELPIGAAVGGSLNGELLVTMKRFADAAANEGGDPLLFVKPYGTKDRNEPSLDARARDIQDWADLRSFSLQQPNHFVLQRLRGPPDAIDRRWIVAVFNNNHSRTQQRASIELTARYLDLDTAPLACPFDCSGGGSCRDPFRVPVPMPGGDARLAPLEGDPFSEGFVCACNTGRGGLLCEGRQVNVTIGASEPQDFGTRTLSPGSWDFFALTLGDSFQRKQSSLAIEWVVTNPKDGNFSNALMAFNQGAFPRQRARDTRDVFSSPGFIRYARLIARSSPPLPLQVSGGDLSPGYTYVLSIYNSPYLMQQNFSYSLNVFVPSDPPSALHPYMSIVLGVTAAVLLCLVMTLAKRLVVRFQLLPPEVLRRLGLAPSGTELDAAGNGGLAMSSRPRGVPPEVFGRFPTLAYRPGLLATAHSVSGTSPGTAQDAAPAAAAADVTTGVTAAGDAGDDPCCVVCLEDLEEGDLLRELPCHHRFFHVECIDTWLKSHSTCPVCRQLVWDGPDPENPESGGSEAVAPAAATADTAAAGVQTERQRVRAERRAGRAAARAAAATAAAAASEGDAPSSAATRRSFWRHLGLSRSTQPPAAAAAAAVAAAQLAPPPAPEVEGAQPQAVRGVWGRLIAARAPRRLRHQRDAGTELSVAASVAPAQPGHVAASAASSTDRNTGGVHSV